MSRPDHSGAAKVRRTASSGAEDTYPHSSRQRERGYGRKRSPCETAMGSQGDPPASGRLELPVVRTSS